ncbi:MAG: hypothetical protein AB1324_08400 [Candidatus Micrarchaeota archaeon]
MKKIVSGRGTNLKTGREIKFSVPSTLSDLGVEKLVKNVKPAELADIGTTEKLDTGCGFDVAIDILKFERALAEGKFRAENPLTTRNKEFLAGISHAFAPGQMADADDLIVSLLSAVKAVKNERLH